MGHHCCVDAHPNMQEKVLSGREGFLWLLVRFQTICWLLITAHPLSKSQAFYLYVPKINLARLAVHNRQSRFCRIMRYTDCPCPYIVRATW